MIDTYLASKDKDVLVAFCGFFVNSMTIAQGRAASPEVHDVESGTVFEAEAAKGDPDYFYTCIRAPFAVPACIGVEVVCAAVGKDVCGVWG